MLYKNTDHSGCGRRTYRTEGWYDRIIHLGVCGIATKERERDWASRFGVLNEQVNSTSSAPTYRITGGGSQQRQYHPRSPSPPHQPIDSSYIHLLIQRRSSSKIKKVDEVANISRLPNRLLVTALEIRSGAAHRERQHGVLVGERKRLGLWSGADAEEVWHVGDLKSEVLIFRSVVRLNQILHRVNV